MSRHLCISCGEDDVTVIDSRPSTTDLTQSGMPRWVEHGAIRRRRKCNLCGERWTTYEIAAVDLDRSEEAAKRRIMNDILGAFGQEQVFAWCIEQGRQK